MFLNKTVNVLCLFGCINHRNSIHKFTIWAANKGQRLQCPKVSQLPRNEPTHETGVTHMHEYIILPLIWGQEFLVYTYATGPIRSFALNNQFYRKDEISTALINSNSRQLVRWLLGMTRQWRLRSYTIVYRIFSDHFLYTSFNLYHIYRRKN